MTQPGVLSRPTPEAVGRRATRAVLPSGGLATRLLPLTKAVPKELLPAHDLPVLHHLLDEVVDAGVRDALVVGVRGKSSLDDYLDPSDPALALNLGDRYDLALASVKELARVLTVHTVRQAGPSGMGLAVLRAADHVGREPFAVVTGDELVDRDAGLLTRMIDEQSRHGGITLAVAPVDDTEVAYSDMCAVGADLGDGVLEVTGVVKRPRLADAPGRLALVGRYVLPPEIFDVLGGIDADDGGEVQLPDAMVALMTRGIPVHAVRYEGARHDVATPWGLLTTSIELALRDRVSGPRLASWLTERLVGRPAATATED